MKVARLQQQQYDKENPEHVALLDSLWRALKPGTRREDWGEIGFQNGLVPESDFRGMGMLGEFANVDANSLFWYAGLTSCVHGYSNSIA